MRSAVWFCAAGTLIKSQAERQAINIPARNGRVIKLTVPCGMAVGKSDVGIFIVVRSVFPLTGVPCSRRADVYIYNFTRVYEQSGGGTQRGFTISIKRVACAKRNTAVSTIVTSFSLERVHRLALSLTPTMIEFQWRGTKEAEWPGHGARAIGRLKYGDTWHCYAARSVTRASLLAAGGPSPVRRYIRCLTHQFEVPPHSPIRDNRARAQSPLKGRARMDPPIAITWLGDYLNLLCKDTDEHHRVDSAYIVGSIETRSTDDLRSDSKREPR